MLCTEGDQNRVPRPWFRGGRGKERNASARPTGSFWEKQAVQKPLQQTLYGKKIIGEQWLPASCGTGKGSRRETVLCCGCIGSQASEAADPNGFSGASQNTGNSRLLPPRGQSWRKILYLSGCTILRAPHGHDATRAQPLPANRQSTMGSRGCPGPPQPRRHGNPFVPSAGIEDPTAGLLSRHSQCIENRGSTGSAIKKRCFPAYRRETGQ